MVKHLKQFVAISLILKDKVTESDYIFLLSIYI